MECLYVLFICHKSFILLEILMSSLTSSCKIKKVYHIGYKIKDHSSYYKSLTVLKTNGLFCTI